jgi:aromatic ring-cleaving dioxygenase
MIKYITGYALITGFLLLMTGCPYGGYKYDQGRFPYDPVNFEAVNSEFDDYNSTAPFIESSGYLFFSSNRNSNGGQFDIIGDHFHVYFDKDDGELTIDNITWDWEEYAFTDSLLRLINTPSNELGPFSIPFYTYHLDTTIFTNLVIYANDEPGNLDLNFAWFEGYGNEVYPQTGNYYGPHPISFLNSQFNDAYLTFYGPTIVMDDWIVYSIPLVSELLFCSDRNGNFDIFQAPVPEGTSIIEFLSGDINPPINAVSILNSVSDDKCPYINGNLLVFASNRPGGYGGFDLYFSERIGNTWSEPLNYGERINTEYDEYRPIILSQYEFVNDMMLFSSNRPGGKGGYDLYYVGIPKMIY